MSIGELNMLGILHQDIKPLNILMINNSEVKIIDYGLSKLIKK